MAVEVIGRSIQIPQGDTGVVKFLVEKTEIGESDRALFTVASRSRGTILRKVLTPGEEEGVFRLPFVYEDTAALKPDSYEWSLRVARNGTFNEKGRITDVGELHTPILKGRLTVLPVAGGAR